ncbi:MAG: carbonic anhydrase [Candidatus Eisenbacteria bacterium]|nr:carbonic anhydrase [Candidatus Eisenbacteria bacterium]
MHRRHRLVAVIVTLALAGFAAIAAAQHDSHSSSHSAAVTSAPPKAAAPKAKVKETKEAKTAAIVEPDARPWAQLMSGNRRFVKGEHLVTSTRDLRNELANGQHPDVIVLTCSDSRLSPEWIFDQPMGEVFVVRTAGNLVDPIALGSIEYAVEHLHAKLLVVMGHEKCGAVAAAVSGEDMPTENLDAIVRKIRPGIPPARANASKDALLQDAIEANIRRSATDCVVASPIVREHVVHGTLAVVQAVYHLQSGEVEELGNPTQLSDNDKR